MHIFNGSSSMHMSTKKAVFAAFCLIVSVGLADTAQAKPMNGEAGGLYIPVSRSELVILPDDVAQVLIADPDVADVHVVGSKRIAFIGKKMGHTNAKLFDKSNNMIRQFDIIIGYDLPAIRKALHFFLPAEHIGVELVNTNVALTGEVSDASAATKAVEIVNQFVAPTSAGQVDSATVLNLLKISSGQQVMLRVKVGEIQRTALKNLGVDLTATKNGAVSILGGSLGGVNAVSNTVGGVLNPIGLNPGNTGVIGSFFHVNSLNIGAVLEALETEGLFKLLAEPNLVAMSGEKAEFLAGGEFPIPVPQTGGSATVTTVQFKDYGVAVQFVPYVIDRTRIRIAVSPEVSEIDTSQSTTTNGVTVPGLTTRRAKTTVELAPGESFMIAGLMSDRLNSTISQIPGASEIPILGALFRSISYNRDETELVISVTPYIVDPVKSSDIKLPTDDFRPASVMEQFFYGVMGSMSGNAYRTSQTPSLEGPIGFMTD
jgi:pilus assembly protein CpaC